MKWAGCNYWKNEGNVPEEPAGTATSMHDCGGCEFDGACSLQQETETWPFPEGHVIRADREMARLWSLKPKTDGRDGS